MIPDEIAKKFKPKRPVPATMDEVRALELALGVRLPELYVELVTIEDEGHLGPIVTPFERDFHFNLHAVDVSRFRLVAMGVLDAWSPGAPPKELVEIGGPGNGDAVMLDYRSNPQNPQVILWMHELSSWGPSGEGIFHYLAADFAELIDRSLKGRRKYYREADARRLGGNQITIVIPGLEPSRGNDEREEWEYDFDSETDVGMSDTEILRWLEDRFPTPPRPENAERYMRGLRKGIKFDSPGSR